MGRVEPSAGQPPASVRKAARAKRAKNTINQIIPSLLSAHPRARKGIEASELIVEPKAVFKNVSSERTSPLSSPQADCRNSSTNHGSVRLRLQVADTLTIARKLLPEERIPHVYPYPFLRDTVPDHYEVAILNMASPLGPGGGFLSGATSQEESLCMRTTLLPSLKDEWYRLPELGAIFTPDVLVFRDEDGGGGGGDNDNKLLDKNERWFVNCITAAMLRNPDTEEEEGDGKTGHRQYVNDKDRQLARDKMKMVMRICQVKGIRKVVVGAWGCGAYGNPVGEIARAWRSVLVPKPSSKSKKGKECERWDGVEEVVFAIKDPGMAEAFRTAFGHGLELDHQRQFLLEEEADEGGDAEQAAYLNELQAKMTELRIRMESTPSPVVREGLNTVLTRMESQLAAAEHQVDGDRDQ